MSSRSRFKVHGSRFGTLCVCGWLVGAPVAAASSMEQAPRPDRGTLVSEQRVTVQYGEALVSGFIVPQPATQTLADYRKALELAGWKPARDLSAAPSAPQTPALVFSKNDTMLTTVAQDLKAQGTLLILSRFPLPAGVKSLADLQKLTPDELNRLSHAEQPTLRDREPAGIPRYPGSRLLASATGREGKRMFQYESEDAPEKILSFYRSRLQGGGWQVGDSLSFDDPQLLAAMRQASVPVQPVMKDLAGGTVLFEGPAGSGSLVAAGENAPGARSSLIILSFHPGRRTATLKQGTDK